MIFGDWHSSRKIRRLLREDCAQISTNIWDVNLILSCVYQEYREDIDEFLSLYWDRVPETLGAEPDKSSERQREQRRLLVLRSLACCGDNKCQRRPKEGLDRLLGNCGCEKSFYIFKAGGNARPLIRRHARQIVERLLVSGVMDPVVVPKLSEDMDVEINNEVLQGSTLYVLAQEIGWLPERMGTRLSFDLADLLVQVLGIGSSGETVDLGSLGNGQWVLNGFFDHVVDYARSLSKPTEVAAIWPRFKDDWRALGGQLCESYATKFKRRLGRKGGD